MFKSYKVELDPNNKQKTAFAKHAGCARFVYNWMLGLIEDDYKSGEKKYNISAMDFSKLLNSIKDEQFPWLREVSSCARTYALRHCETAYKRFFNKVSDKPKFKKKGIKDSFSLQGFIHVTNTHIQLPIIGKVKLKEYNYVPIGKAKSITVSKQAGRWFASVTVEVPDEQQPETNWQEDVLGVDLGIKIFVVCSDETEIKGNNKLKKKEKTLKRLQRKLARQKPGSKSKEKTKLKLQKQHFKIGNARKDLIHKATTTLAKTKPEKYIAIEDLNVSGMMKNHKLAKAIGNCGFGMFREFLNYKAGWMRKKVIIVDRFFPSSKLDHKTGLINHNLTLKDRVIKHPDGTETDRDLNAAINLKNYGEQYIEWLSTVSLTGIQAGVGEIQLKRDEKFIFDFSKRCSLVKPESNIKLNFAEKLFI